MAKKKLRKVEEEDDDEFGPPPFDEREFYSTELELAKATMVAALWGILIAVVAAAVFAFTASFYIGLAVGVLAALALKPMLDRLRIITRQLETMKWLGMFFSYFMCWVAFWILLVNPPIMDLSPPQLRDRTPAFQELGSALRISIEIKENSGINSLTADIVQPGGAVDKRDNFLEVTTKLFQLDLNYTATGVYNYHIRVEDGTGKSASRDGQTVIVPSMPPVINLIALQNNSNITVDTPIYFNVTDNALISGVHYTIDSNPEKLFLKPIKSYQSWVSDNVKNNVYRIKPNTAGHPWAAGAHNMTISASDAGGNVVNASYSFIII
jgi:hypothetical protein